MAGHLEWLTKMDTRQWPNIYGPSVSRRPWWTYDTLGGRKTIVTDIGLGEENMSFLGTPDPESAYAAPHDGDAHARFRR